MHSRLLSRRHLLRSSTALLAVGTIFAGPTDAQPPFAALSATNPALLSALTQNLRTAEAAHAGLAHKGQVQRVVMPALLRSPKNPHFVPQGSAFSPAEQATFKPAPVTLPGL